MTAAITMADDCSRTALACTGSLIGSSIDANFIAELPQHGKFGRWIIPATLRSPNLQTADRTVDSIVFSAILSRPCATIVAVTIRALLAGHFRRRNSPHIQAEFRHAN
jgi:hypothetical protein